MSELISDAKVFPLREPKKGLLANGSFTVAGAFVLKCLVREGKDGVWVAMPARAGKDKEGNTRYYDECFPITKEARAEMTEKIIAAYEEATKGGSEESKPKKGDEVPF